MKRTKIICTLGPSSQTEKIITRLVKAGMNVARLNFSHGTHNEHKRKINIVRQVSTKLDQPVAVLQDLQGPRIRLGKLPKTGFVLQPKEKIILSGNGRFVKADKQGLVNIPVTYNKLHLDVKKGQKILLVDGLIELVVLKKSGNKIYCQVKNGGLINTHKGINLPETKLSIPTITAKDKKDLEFGIKNKVDFVALSFVRSAKDVIDLKKIITRLEKKYQKNNAPTQIIVKIEKPEAMKNFKQILQEADAVMIARGDLGIELDQSKVPIIQKDIIDQCLKVAKPVIVATQMLESMMESLQPLRAEVSDVANAVIDHADALMLSGETASGKYPIEAVNMMNQIITQTEKSKYDDLQFIELFKGKLKKDDAVFSGANLLAKNLKAKAVLAATLTGNTVKIISRYRPEMPILAPTNNEKIKRQLNLSWGVAPFFLGKSKTIDDLLESSLKYIKNKKFVEKDDLIIIAAGFPMGDNGNIDWLKIYKVK